MLGQPALIAGHDRGDTQGVALLTQQGIAAIAGPIGPDLAGFGIVDNVLIVIAGPRHIGLTLSQGGSEAVDRRHKEPILANGFQRRRAHSGHDAHGNGDIGAIGNFNAQRTDARADRAHTEGHNIEGATLHAACKQALKLGAHLVWRHPIVGRTSVDLFVRTDKGAAFHPGHIARVGIGGEGVGPLGRIETHHGARGNQLCGQLLPLGIRAIAPMDPIRGRQGSDLTDPSDQFGMFGWRRIKSGNRRDIRHRVVSKIRSDYALLNWR